MFPKRSPPVTVISTNAHYDPYLHTAIGAAVRPLRYQNVLIIGTGVSRLVLLALAELCCILCSRVPSSQGTVHNLYRNAWDNIILYRDNFAQTRPPQQWALDFRNETLDAFTRNTGPALRRAAMRLMRHPLFRDAHGTDDHYAPVLFCAGAAGDQDDIATKNTSPAEVWELEQMCNVRRRSSRPSFRAKLTLRPLTDTDTIWRVGAGAVDKQCVIVQRRSISSLSRAESEVPKPSRESETSMRSSLSLSRLEQNRLLVSAALQRLPVVEHDRYIPYDED